MDSCHKRLPLAKAVTTLHMSILQSAAIILILSDSASHANLGPSFAQSQTSPCHQEGATCVPLTGSGSDPPTCFGTALRFAHTSLLWANDSSSLAEVTSRLKMWEGLRKVPQCWAVVQPFLCSVYLPKCDPNTSRVEYPSVTLCERTREPCRIVEQLNTAWPAFLRCSQPYFKRSCGSDGYDQLTFNTTAQCEPPLVRTDTQDSWWEGVEGCGVKCQSPLYTPEEQHQAHAFVAAMGSLCLISTLFTILTFIVDWQNANRYPALILFFVNVCFFMGTVGWMAQFSGGARQDIACRSDGTARKHEPQLGSGETAACTVVFVIVYYFMMAGLLWFVMLCFAWHVTFRALGTPRDDLASKTAYFHLVSWSLPLVLTIVCLAISEIDGDWLSGICFVGYNNHKVRAGFVLVPVLCVTVVGLFFLVKGLATLIQIKKDAPSYVGERATSKLRETIIRLGIFSALSVVFGIITFSVHIYIFVHEGHWQDSFKKYMYCLINVTVSDSTGSQAGPRTCAIAQRPSVVAMEINMFAYFGAGIAMSSWSWTKASLSAWERFFRKICNKPSSKPVKLTRHKMIAQAFERRRDANNGRVSVSFHSTHDDPLGMKLDLHSVSSNMSNMSNFANNVPRLLRRRGGLVHPAAGTLRRYSDSDIASVMSRRLSQSSQQMNTHDGQFVYIERDNSSNNGGSVGGWTRRRRRRRKRRKKRNAVQPILGPVLSGVGFPGLGGGVMRRGSDTSVFSKASAQRIRMHMEGQGHKLGGSLSSLPGNEHVLSVSDTGGRGFRMGGSSRRSRRKLPRLQPLKRSSSSRSSLSQLGFGMYGGHPQGQFHHVPYPHLYGGYDYAAYYANMYPQLAYPPYWQPYAYPHPQYPSHPSLSTHPQLHPHPPPTTDFSMFSTNSTSLPGATGSSPEVERRRVMLASTSRRSEVTVETQQTEFIPLKTLSKSVAAEFKKPAPLSDDSIEDLNSSQLEDSGAESESAETEVKV